MPSFCNRVNRESFRIHVKKRLHITIRQWNAFCFGHKWWNSPPVLGGDVKSPPQRTFNWGGKGRDWRNWWHKTLSLTNRQKLLGETEKYPENQHQACFLLILITDAQGVPHRKKVWHTIIKAQSMPSILSRVNPESFRIFVKKRLHITIRQWYAFCFGHKWWNSPPILGGDVKSPPQRTFNWGGKGRD
jgi:hypothetical protein